MSPRNGCVEVTGITSDENLGSAKFLAGVRLLEHFCVWGRAEQTISTYLHW